MPSVKSLSFGVACLLACPSSAGALFLGVREDGLPTILWPSHGPATDTVDGRPPISFWTSWSAAPTPPLTVPAPAKTSSSAPPSSGTVAGPSTTTPGAISPSTSIAPSSLTTRSGTSTTSTEAGIVSQPPAYSAGSDTIITMPSDVPTSSSTDPVRQTDASSNGSSGLSSNRTLTITLSTVLSVVGALMFVGALVICMKCRRRRIPFLTRGISPIDDDEIATWKTSRDEKAALATSGAAAGTRAPASGGNYTTRNPGHGKHFSTASSVRKPPSVIVYQGRHSQQLPRPSGDGGSSPRSIHNSPGSNGRMSFEKDLPQTPIQAVAPNARAGLTDEAVPGADPFLPSPKRHPSRLSKVPPNMATSPRGGGNHAHTRTRSSRSSMRSFGAAGDYGYYTGSDTMELSPRTSNDYYNNMHHGGHSRVYSSSSVPPRLSFGEDGAVGGLSPRPLFRDNNTIGRAIG